MNILPQNRVDLCQYWVQSYEEDTEKELVYRPSTFNFPPSRGRTGFELLADKTCKWIGIAAGDGSEVSCGTWELDVGESLHVRLNFKDSTEVLALASIERDRLAIRKLTPPASAKIP
jgi:hypothetical protein